MIRKLIAAAAAIVFLAIGLPAAAEAQLKPYVGASLGTSFQTVDDLNNQWVLGLAIGGQYGPLRVELGYDRYQQGGGSIAIGRVDSNLVAARVQLDHAFGAIAPYIEGGAGYAWLSGSATAIPGNDDRTGFAWLAGAGVNWNLTKFMAIGIGYEYLRSAAKIDDGNGGSQNWSAHQIKTMLRFTF